MPQTMTGDGGTGKSTALNKLSSMNLHRALDTAVIEIAAALAPKFFRGSVDSPSLREHLNAVSIHMPELRPARLLEPRTHSLIGELRPAFKIVQWKSESVPTIIYHHGMLEIPFDALFRQIIPYRRQNFPLNLIAVRAPYHRSVGEFFRNNDTLSKWIAMLASSVALIDELVLRSKVRNSARVMVAGMSLGGYIANLHCIQRGSADVYAPLLAGTRLGDEFFDTLHRKALSDLALSNEGLIKERLNAVFPDVGSLRTKLFPLLASHDALMRFDTQRSCYEDIDVKTVNRAHYSGTFSFAMMREHLLESLFRVHQSGA